MATAPESARVDALERRAIWLIALATVAIIFGSLAGVFTYFDELEWWRAALVIAGQAALVASVGLACLSLVPGRAPAVRIERIVLWAFGLFWVALVLSFLNVTISLIQAVGDSGFE